MTKPATLNTLSQFRREVERQVKSRAKGITVTWQESMRVKYPTGLMGYRGIFHVSGGGMTETVEYLAQYDKHTDGLHTLSVKPLGV